MKVKFLKKHRLGGKQFVKDDIAQIHWQEGQKLLKKGVVEETDIITEEDKALKQFLDDGNNG